CFTAAEPVPRALGLVDEKGTEHDEAALGEVDDACGAEDHDEPERDQRVHGAERQAVGEQGEELRHAAYIRSMRSWNWAAAIPRRTFCVAVRAPVSSRSMGSSSNPWSCSSSSSCRFTSLTALSISRRTSGFSMRSRCVVNWRFCCWAHM